MNNTNLQQCFKGKSSVNYEVDLGQSSYLMLKKMFHDEFAEK